MKPPKLSPQSTLSASLPGRNPFPGLYPLSFDNFHLFLQEQAPVLIACFRPDQVLLEQMQSLLSVCSLHGKQIKVGLIQENFMPHFMSRYHITGTPTFVLFQQQHVVDQLLGWTDTTSLFQFVEPWLKYRGSSLSEAPPCLKRARPVEKVMDTALAGRKILKEGRNYGTNKNSDHRR